MLHRPTPKLRLSLGQASSAGPKPENQDFHGAMVPEGQVLALKGAVIALADGISTSDVGRVAAETAVKALMTDYYATPDTWTVQTSAARVIAATNSWLHAQTQFSHDGDRERGLVCTLAALIVKGRSAHIFHAGDSRVWRLSGGSLEPLTRDHSAPYGGQSVLSRAMGLDPHLELDYRTERLSPGDVFLLTTDGVHDSWQPRKVAADLAQATDLDALARQIVDEALAAGSADNLTVQILRIDALPEDGASIDEDAALLPLPAALGEGDRIDGFTLLREVHSNHRSRLFLARAPDGGRVAVKLPAVDLREDPAALRRLMMEEWIARRLASPHVMGAPEVAGRSALYTVTDWVEGKTLRQWLHDTPKRGLTEMREIAAQIVIGLRAFHRREMLHQDLRPENVMIDTDGTVTLIDFGSAHVAGVQEGAAEDGPILGTLQYTAPEYFTGEQVSWRSDQFSLGVMLYEMLSGALPYGAEVSRLRQPADRARLRYRPLPPEIPGWIDAAIARACHPNPRRRFDALSELLAALKAPGADYVARNRRPLIERDPVRFWQGISLFLAIACATLLWKLTT